MKKLFGTFCFLLLSGLVSAQDYTASHLEKAARKLNIVGLLSKNSLTDTLTVSGQHIVVRRDAQGQVVHIGIPLFNTSIRNLQPSPIHDYLEFAALDKKFQVSENTLQLNRLRFSKGGWEQLFQLGDTTACTISSLDDKTYVVQWQRNGSSIVEVSFPVDYELLANSTRREMETKFIAELKNYKSAPSRLPTTIDSTQLKKYAIEGIYVKEGRNYIINAITSSTYYAKSKQDFQLVYVPQHVSESMTDLLLAPGVLPKASVNVKFALSTYREETVDVDYTQLYDFCVASGCEPYFGYEGMVGGMASGTLVMHNRQSGYSHLFYIQCPADQVGKPGVQLRGTAYIYIPSSNIKNLLAAPSKGHSKSYKFISR